MLTIVLLSLITGTALTGRWIMATSKEKVNQEVKANSKKTSSGTTQNPRSISVAATLGGKDVSSRLIDSASFVDVAHGSSDSAEFTLDNSDLNYLKKGLPAKGSTATLNIKTKDWTIQPDTTIKSGKMYVDSMTVSGPEPESVEVQALSMPSYSGFSATEHHKTYKKTTAKAILKKIASRNKMKLKYYGPTVKITTIQQDGATDSDFVIDLCERYGLRVKITNRTLYVYSAARYAQKAAAIIIKRSVAASGYEYTNDIQGAYTYATNTYQDKKKKKDVKVSVGHKKIKTTYTYYQQATLKRPVKARKSKSGHAASTGTFKKGARLKVVKLYDDGWAKIATTKTYTRKVWMRNGSKYVGKLANLFKVCRSQLGVRSGRKYGQPGAWCGAYCRWCLRKSGNGHAIAGLPNPDYAPNWKSWAQAHGRWSHTPHPGDAVVFNFSGRSSVQHVGLVYKVHSAHNIETYEGNTTGGTGGALMCRHVHRTSGILGYIHLGIDGNGSGIDEDKVYKSTGKNFTWTKEYSNQVAIKRNFKKTVYSYVYLGKGKGKNRKNAKLKTVRVAHKHNISRTLAVDTAGYNKADAKRIAKYKMAQANESIEKLTMTIPGGYNRIKATNTVRLQSEWGKLAGKWFLDQVTHQPSSSGFYTQEIEMHKINSSNGGKVYRKKGSKAKFKGGYVHSSSKGGKATKIKGGMKVKIRKVDTKGKYTYQIESLSTYSKWKKKTVSVKGYGPSDRKNGKGSTGRTLTNHSCACDWLPIGSKVTINGKQYTVDDRTHGKKGILIYHTDENYKPGAAKSMTIKYKKVEKKTKVLGWVSSAELASLSTPQKKADSSKTSSVNKHGRISTSKGEFKVVKTLKASFSYYSTHYGSWLMGYAVKDWTGLCVASNNFSKVPRGSYIRIIDSRHPLKGKIMKVVDYEEAQGGPTWHGLGIDVHCSAAYARAHGMAKIGRYNNTKFQVLKKV